MKKLLPIALLILAAAVSGGLYALLRAPEAASGRIQAIPIAVAQSEAFQSAAEAPAETEAGNAATDPEVATDNETVAETTAAGPVIFSIVPERSEARFIIDEVLNGSPKTVVGVTEQVAGEIAIDFTKPSASQLGTILVNARDLETDSSLRNRAIKNFILTTDRYEFVMFTPTGLVGLPDTLTLGASYELQITGELTVRDVTRPVTFAATVTPVSETELTGTARTTILYPDYGLVIPEARSVTSVADEVVLELVFTALAS